MGKAILRPIEILEAPLAVEKDEVIGKSIKLSPLEVEALQKEWMERYRGYEKSESEVTGV